jgi:hypothetical protein
MVKAALTAVLAISAIEAHAKALYLLEPKDVYIDAFKYQSLHDPYLAPIDKDLLYGAAFNTDFNVFRYGNIALHWKNRLHFDQAGPSGHIKHAGWEYELGLPLWIDKGKSKIELFKQHHSRHVLEEVRDAHFPVYDQIGLRIRLLP